MRIYSVGIYLLKVNNGNSRTSCVICSHQNDLIDMKTKKVLSCKLYNNQYIIASTQITSTVIFAFIAILVFKLLSYKVLFINRKDNRNC